MMAYRLLSVLRGGSRCNYAVAGLAPITRTSFRRVSTGGGVLERATNMIKNDPFVKLSLSLCALIVGGTLVMEMYNRVRKNSSPALSMLPPGFTHHSIKRKSQLQDLQSKVQKHSSKQAPPVFYITGPPGSGKTELVRQLCQEYTSKKWLGLRSVPALVVSISATSKELLHISLGEVTNQLGLQPSVDTLTTFSKILSWLSSSRLPWLLVIDDLTESTQPSLDALLKECIPDMVFSQCPGAVLITTCLPVSPSSPQHFHLEQRLVYNCQS